MIVTDDQMMIVSMSDGSNIEIGETNAFLLKPLDTLCTRNNRFFTKNALSKLQDSGMWQGTIEHYHNNSEYASLQVRAYAIRNSSKEIVYYTLFLNHTDKTFLHTTQIDSLTKLPNRTYLIEALDKKLSSANQDKELTALLFIEFDDLARFNETFGFDIDDQLIVQLSKKIKSLLGLGDVLARVGNEQFAIVSQNVQSEEGAEMFAKRIISMLYEPFLVDPHMFYISASIGISLSSADENDAYRLLKTAENTMRLVQKDGKNHIAFTQYKIQSSFQESIRLMEDLPAALENGEIYFVYQGQYSHDEQRFNGAELLARWRHPKYGEVSPAIFIPLAEQSGMIGPLTMKALIEASNMFAKLEAAGIEEFSLSVNISSVVLMASDFIETVEFLRCNYNLAGKKLNFEIMEETLTQNIENLVQLLEKIREMGIGIEIDDYGTGYTSLKYLADLPINTLKVDRSYVRDLDQDTKRKALFQAIVDMSHALEIDVIAEGVETALEDDIIKTFESITVQGYFYSKPTECAIFLDKLQGQ
ncbi:MAG: bifunctional diguanylate cyclase/phosphodiesterase [Sulfurimonadaceae bacterium]